MDSSLRGAEQRERNEAIHTYCHSERSEESKNKKRIFGYFALRLNMTIRKGKEWIASTFCKSLAMTIRWIATPSLRGSNATEAIHTKEMDYHESPKQTKKQTQKGAKNEKF